MAKVLVTGSGGFIGYHLVNKLKSMGHWVRGVDLKYPEFGETQADEFQLADLRNPGVCTVACTDVDEIYHLAANMGGVGYLNKHELEILQDNALININMSKASDKKLFFSSSACVYRDMKIGDPEIDESGAYPANPDNEYGWEKLFAERIFLKRGNTRIARFQNCYGPYGVYDGGKEKAPAALCRKAIKGNMEVWGDGSAVRNYIYINDLIDGILNLMASDIKEPVNIGTDEYVSVDELAKMIIKISGKDLKINHIEGTVGVKSRNFSNKKIKSIWRPSVSLEAGLKEIYEWINAQLNL